MQTINDKIIIKTRLINASLDTLWWQWTTPEGLLTFFGRGNNIALRLGGPYEIYFLDSPEGQRGGEGNKILSYLPKEMLSFTWNAPPEHPDIRNHPHRAWVVVNFKSITKNRTEVSIQHLGWLDGPKWDKVYQYFDIAWTTVLDWLENSSKESF